MIACCFGRSWNELIWHWLVTVTQYLIFEASRDFARSRWPFWMRSCDQQRRFKITDSRSTKRCYYVVSTVWWRHQMETFSVSLTLCKGNPPVTRGFPSQRPVMRSFVFFSVICTWTNHWANNRDAGGLRRHRAHHDVTVMGICWWSYTVRY